MITLEQLQDLTKFLEGLTELSLQTGVAVAPHRHYRPDIQVGDEFLTLVVGKDEHGNATYAVTKEDDE